MERVNLDHNYVLPSSEIQEAVNEYVDGKLHI